MNQAVQAAIARFPDRGHAIAELALTDESFRSLCEDLAEVETALALWERSASPESVARCTEYRSLVTDLAAELAAELDRHARDRRRP